MSNEELRTRSGNVNVSSRLTSFLYDLMRDHLTPGVVEELVQESAAIEVAYTNGWLALYAFDLAKRLLNPLPESELRLSTPDPNKVTESLVEEQRPAPKGTYGVFCEPLGHKNNPCWTNSPPKSYEEAVKEADLMNRANPAWHYYAKPIR